MEERLEKYLYKKYPELFKNESKSSKESSMVWGCCCGDGWFFLLDNLCSAITKYITRQHEMVEYCDDLEKKGRYENPDVVCSRPIEYNLKVDQVHFDQVKEKFGLLRIYYTGGDNTIGSMINFSERLSESICEECGKFDYSIGRTVNGWIRSICKECSENDERGWKQTSPELEELFKLAMKDKEENKDKKLDLAIQKLEELKLRDKK